MSLRRGGLQYKRHADLQEYRPAGAPIQKTCGSTRISPCWGSNTKDMRIYKNIAPLGLQYKRTCGSTRISPRWGSNTKGMRIYKNIAPLGLQYKRTCGYTRISPRWGSNSIYMRIYKNVAPPRRTLMQNTCRSTRISLRRGGL